MPSVSLAAIAFCQRFDRISFIEAAKDMHFRNVFLMTFRTFMTADQLFDMLVDIYGMEHPRDISEPEFDDWKEKCWLPTQRTVMTVFTMWLEDHRLLEEEPHIAQKLTDFLNLIPQRNVMATTAKLIMQSIKRLVSELLCELAIILTPSRVDIQ